MVDCPEGIKKYIRWKYPGEDWSRIEGDNYAISRKIGQCPVEYHAFGTYISKGKAICNKDAYWRTSIRVNGANVISFVPERYGNKKVGIPMKNGSYTRIKPTSESDYNNRYLGGQSTLFIDYRGAGESCNGRFEIYDFGHGFKLTEVIRIDGLPDDCGKCVLTITKNQQIVLEETNNDCPKAEEYCDDNTCPEGTCECTHGSIVCCHDSFTGEVVKRFRRYKNN